MAARTWLAVALCCFIWFSYMKWFSPIPPEALPTVQAPAKPGEASAPTAPGTSPAVAGETLFGPVIVPTDDIEFASPKQVLTFSSAGGKLNSVLLPEYKESMNKDAGPIRVQGSDLSPYNLATIFTDPMLQMFSDTKYRGEKLKNGVHFGASHGDIAIEGLYDLGTDDYFMQRTVKLTFPANEKRRDWGYLMIPLGASTPTYDHDVPLASWESVWAQNDKYLRRPAKSIEKPVEVLQGTTGWLAFGNRYFATAVINESEINPDVVLVHSPHFTGGYLRYPLVRKDGQNQLTFKFKMFAGPKLTADLDKIPGLKHLVDYGTFSWLAYPMLEVLRFLYKLVHNYGIAIILLTIFVRMLFYPLSMKSMRSMKSMQRLQPQIAALKEKYKDDAQRFNQEQMALFKTHKVNPLGGCLPMLVQLPVFIALYAVLGNSIELFHSPFFGWIQDLSSKDPFYILPILMGLSMLLQTKMTPSASADPVQQKMMYLMPVVFTFIMLKLPSGLTLYIFVSTLLGITQQWAMRDPLAKTAAVTTTKTSGAPEKG